MRPGGVRLFLILILSHVVSHSVLGSGVPLPSAAGGSISGGGSDGSPPVAAAAKKQGLPAAVTPPTQQQQQQHSRRLLAQLDGDKRHNDIFVVPVAAAAAAQPAAAVQAQAQASPAPPPARSKRTRRRTASPSPSPQQQQQQQQPAPAAQGPARAFLDSRTAAGQSFILPTTATVVLAAPPTTINIAPAAAALTVAAATAAAPAAATAVPSAPKPSPPPAKTPPPAAPPPFTQRDYENYAPPRMVEQGILSVVISPLEADGASVPNDFLGTSHEWSGVEHLASDEGAAAAFSNIFSALGTSPILRIGGHSQELLTKPPKEPVWRALRALRDRAGARFIIGLPLERRGAPKVARAMVALARRWLGDASVVGYELGNEPDMWASRAGGWSGANATKWTPGAGAYARYFDATASALSGCNRTAGGLPSLPPASPRPSQAPAAPPPAGPSPPPASGIADAALGDGVYEADRARFEAERELVLAAQRDALLAAMGAHAAAGVRRLAAAPSSAAPAAPAAAAAAPAAATAPAAANAPPPRTSKHRKRRRRAPVAPPGPIYMGPAWHNIQLNPDVLRLQAQLAARCGYLKALTVHYYCWECGEAIRKGAGIGALLSEPALRSALQRIKALVAAARGAGLPLAISEANSINGGGLAGYSESYGAALWTADFAFEAARAGAEGLNMHWGVGGHPTNGGPPYTAVQVNYKNGRPWPSVHAPWFGYLLFAHATQGPGPVRFVRADAARPADAAAPAVAAAGAAAAGATASNATANPCTAAIKVFALTGGDVPAMSQSGRTLRVVAINKDETRACGLDLAVRGRYGEGLAVWLLPGRKGLMSKGGITWRAQFYEGTDDGKIAGAALMQRYAPTVVATAPGGDAGSGSGSGGGVFSRYQIERLAPGHAIVITAAAAA